MQAQTRIQKSRSTSKSINKEKFSATQLKQVIRDIGLKVTHQRLIILNAILKGREHITAQEVFENVMQEDSSIGFATVYRFLRSLAENNFVTELRMKGLPARYEWADKKHHDHLTCIDCGTIREFENANIEKLQLKIAEDLGFVLTDHVMELYGLCPDCQRKKGMKNVLEPKLPTQQSTTLS